MHELGLVTKIIDHVEQVGREHKLTAVSRVTIDLGEVSGVVPRYMEDYWQWAANKSRLLRGSELRFETLPAVTICNSCRKTYPTIPQGKQCPHCESFDTVLLRGNEFIIREIEAC